MAIIKKKISFRPLLKALSSVSQFIARNASINVFLVLTLVIFSFFLGMLTNKVIYLEQQVNNPSANLADAANQPGTPVAPPAVVENLSVGKLPVVGNKDAKVTMIEFSDFQCPFCKRYFDETHKQIIDTYVNTGKIKFAYRHFPLISIHPNAQKAAEASECANDQGKFWEYHDLLFANQDTWSPKTAADAATDFVSFAGELGLNSDQFQSCLTSDKNKNKVEADMSDASVAQVDGTPAFFINGNRVVGAVPFADLQKVIEQELKK